MVSLWEIIPNGRTIQGNNSTRETTCKQEREMAEQEQTVATQAGNELTAESGNVQANILNETTRTSTTPHQPPDDDEPPHDNEPQQNKSKATQDQIAKLGDSLEGLVQRTVNARQRQAANLLEDSWAGMEVGKPGPQVRETPRSQEAVQAASQPTSPQSWRGNSCVGSQNSREQQQEQGCTQGLPMAWPQDGHVPTEEPSPTLQLVTSVWLIQ
jgi:hypothetical protein